MTTPTLGKLDLVPASADHMAAPVAATLEGWAGPAVYTAAIDPELSDTAAFCAHYDVGLDVSANCVIVSGKRDGELRWAAVVVLASTRADVNGVVRRLVDVRKVSFASMDDAVSLTGMEYGGITPIGLPAGWPIFIDAAVTTAGLVIIGSGVRSSKIAIDGAALADLPGARVIDGLAR
ncbi:YbaK/EbsC family protein [Nakamurella panacisegetis]|uniref:YbaK/EbsC family protein n=1 Tax=Nakamurella panacisegetis TaxID=1090615 RepID=UPI001E386AD4|nr:YbaK/EbsC family protein [Nakamurella panacisegetis]